MLGFLLARSGVRVAVLEKHADFFRDFRGDTIHPSTLEVLSELDILEDFLKQPHDELTSLGAEIGGERIAIANFSHLPTRCKFIVFMPQWDFLNFLAGHAKRYPGFALTMQAEVVDLIQENGRISGVQAKTPEGILDIRADLVVGADGRHSTVRRKAGLEVKDIGAPMDVLWIRLSRKPDDPEQTLGRIRNGQFLITINREAYWQCGLVIPKGEFDQIRSRGLALFRDGLGQFAPFLRDRVGELTGWDDIKLLTVMVDRLRAWSRPGLLCIGDAAHAMSPVGGVGINLAIQDAVAAANLLATVLRRGTASVNDLKRVQRRRELPTRLTQAAQVLIQNRVIRRVFDTREPVRPPALLNLLRRWPFLTRIPARVIGMGFRPEHVRIPELLP